MAPSRRPDYPSDSEDEDENLQHLTGIETDILLGIPDGHIDIKNDVIDAAVSRIGGLPALLPSREPPFSSSYCNSCSSPMELLVQMWCPFEDSPMDRALYVWGCARSGCQRKDGSVRAWRGLRYNAAYAAKLKQKREKEERKRKAQEDITKSKAAAIAVLAGGTKANPFSMTSLNAPANPFTTSTNPEKDNSPFGMGTAALGAQIFGAGTTSPQTNPEPSEAKQSAPSMPNLARVKDDGSEESQDEDLEGNDDSDGSDAASLIEALAATEISDSLWKEAPFYPPMYLSTVSEYAPSQPKEKTPKGVVVDEMDLGAKGKDKKTKDLDLNWVKETYENSMEVDQVFERFMKRVGWEGEQCVRYELKGTPLPFATDKTFNLLWPLPPQDPLPTTKAVFKVVTAPKRTYTPSVIPRCANCGSERVFECQLMPNLINVLRPTWEDKNAGGGSGKKKLTDDERRQEVERTLKGGGDQAEKRGMEWGTCMVFSCGRDCAIGDAEEDKDVWREEIVYVQWDV